MLFSKTIEVLPGRQAISKALISAQYGDTLLVASGIYKENISISNGVTLKAAQPLQSTIKGDGRGTTVILNNDSHIEGFIITGGNKGIVANYTDASIQVCIITNNRGSGLLSVSQFPQVQNTVFSHNGSGISATSIVGDIILNHVTLAQNKLHGISFDKCRKVIVSNSLFYKNETKHLNGELGKIVITNSLFYPTQKDITGPEVINQEPFFISKKEMRTHFQLLDGSTGQETASDGGDIGADMP